MTTPPPISDAVYSALAAASYFGKNDTFENTPPIPTGWTAQNYLPMTGALNSFSATAYQNTGTNQIVVAFSGTNFTTYGAEDLVSDGFLGIGAIAKELNQAMQYYETIVAAYPGYSITLAGHSLGGGLAALLSVFLDVPAVTFDAAPFSRAASAAVAYSVFNNPADVQSLSSTQLASLAAFVVKQSIAEGVTPPSDSKLVSIFQTSATVATGLLTAPFKVLENFFLNKPKANLVGIVLDTVTAFAQPYEGDISAIPNVHDVQDVYTPNELMVSLMNLSASSALNFPVHRVVDTNPGLGCDTALPITTGTAQPGDLHSMLLIDAVEESSVLKTSLDVLSSGTQVLVDQTFLNTNPDRSDRENGLSALLLAGQAPLDAVGQDFSKIASLNLSSDAQQTLVKLSLEYQYQLTNQFDPSFGQYGHLFSDAAVGYLPGVSFSLNEAVAASLTNIVGVNQNMPNNTAANNIAGRYAFADTGLMTLAGGSDYSNFSSYWAQQLATTDSASLGTAVTLLFPDVCNQATLGALITDAKGNNSLGAATRYAIENQASVIAVNMTPAYSSANYLTTEQQSNDYWTGKVEEYLASLSGGSVDLTAAGGQAGHDPVIVDDSNHTTVSAIVPISADQPSKIIFGADGGDTVSLAGDSESAIVYGGVGGNTLIGGSGSEQTLYSGGGAGNTLIGGSGTNTLVGADASSLSEGDLLEGGAGTTVIRAGETDTIVGGSGYTQIIAKSGDSISAGTGTGSIWFDSDRSGSDMGFSVAGGTWNAAKGAYVGAAGETYTINSLSADGSANLTVTASDGETITLQNVSLAPSAQSPLGLRFYGGPTDPSTDTGTVVSYQTARLGSGSNLYTDYGYTSIDYSNGSTLTYDATSDTTTLKNPSGWSVVAQGYIATQNGYNPPQDAAATQFEVDGTVLDGNGTTRETYNYSSAQYFDAFGNPESSVASPTHPSVSNSDGSTTTLQYIQAAQGNTPLQDNFVTTQADGTKTFDTVYETTGDSFETVVSADGNTISSSTSSYVSGTDPYLSAETGSYIANVGASGPKVIAQNIGGLNILQETFDSSGQMSGLDIGASGSQPAGTLVENSDGTNSAYVSDSSGNTETLVFTSASSPFDALGSSEFEPAGWVNVLESAAGGSILSDTITHMDGSSVATVWNSDGSTTATTTDASGTVTERSVDSSPSGTKGQDVVDTAYNSDGSQVVTTLVDGQQTSQITIYADGSSDDDETDATSGLTTIYSRNAQHVLTETTEQLQGGGTETITSSGGSTETTDYDNNNIVTYDKVQNSDESSETYVLNSDTSSDSTLVDSAGNQSVIHTNADGTSTETDTLINGNTEAISSNTDGSSTGIIKDSSGNDISTDITQANGVSYVEAPGVAESSSTDFYDAEGEVTVSQSTGQTGTTVQAIVPGTAQANVDISSSAVVSTVDNADGSVTTKTVNNDSSEVDTTRDPAGNIIGQTLLQSNGSFIAYDYLSDGTTDVSLGSSNKPTQLLTSTPDGISTTTSYASDGVSISSFNETSATGKTLESVSLVDGVTTTTLNSFGPTDLQLTNSVAVSGGDTKTTTYGNDGLSIASLTVVNNAGYTTQSVTQQAI